MSQTWPPVWAGHKTIFQVLLTFHMTNMSLLKYSQFSSINPNPTLCTQYTYKFYQITLDHFKLSRINWLQHSHHVKDVPKTKKHGAFGDVKLDQKAQLLNTLCSSAVELEIFLPLPKKQPFPPPSSKGFLLNSNLDFLLTSCVSS